MVKQFVLLGDLNTLEIKPIENTVIEDNSNKPNYGIKLYPLDIEVNGDYYNNTDKLTKDLDLANVTFSDYERYILANRCDINMSKRTILNINLEKIMYIDNTEKLNKLFKKYSDGKYIDYEKLSREYDGLYIDRFKVPIYEIHKYIFLDKLIVKTLFLFSKVSIVNVCDYFNH